jgi:hypothetical protein
LKPFSIGGAKAVTRDFLLVLELYHLFGNIVGGIVSPILSNIYLDKFDTYVEQVLIPAYTRGTKRRFNPEYERLRARAKRRKRAGKRARGTKTLDTGSAPPLKRPS